MLGWKLQGDTLRSQRGRGVSKGPHGPGAKPLGRAFRPWAQTLLQTVTRQLPHGLRASADAALRGSSWGRARDACLRRAGDLAVKMGPGRKKATSNTGKCRTHACDTGRQGADRRGHPSHASRSSGSRSLYDKPRPWPSRLQRPRRGTPLALLRPSNGEQGRLTSRLHGDWERPREGCPAQHAGGAHGRLAAEATNQRLDLASMNISFGSLSIFK